MSRQFKVIGGGLTAFLVFLIFGLIHVVSGADIGTRIVAKASFGFSETFINIDEITGMPWLAARSRYPLSCRALQNAGLLESNSQFKERTYREGREELERRLSETP